jgi:hypothetical protein
MNTTQKIIFPYPSPLNAPPCDIRHVTIIFRSKARKQGFRSYLPFL